MNTPGERIAKQAVSTGICIRKSPVPFVIAAPFGERRRIIVRSEDAGPDLVSVVEASLDLDSGRWNDDLALGHVAGTVAESIFVRRNYHVVRSKAAAISRGNDSRTSFLSFGWKGLASFREEAAVERAFQVMAIEVLRAAEEDDIGSLEWSIGPVVTLCFAFSVERAERKRQSRALAIALGVSTLAVLASLMMRLMARLFM